MRYYFLYIILLFFSICPKINSKGYANIYLTGSKTDSVSYLSQDLISQDYSIYVIEGDYTIKGAIKLPRYSILKFEGGSLHDGIIEGDYNEIVAPRYQIFHNIRLTGHFSVDTVYPEWWGGYPNRDIDCYNALQSAIDFASAYGGNEGKNVKLSVGRYGISKTLILKQGCCLSGVSPRSTWLYSWKGDIKGDWMIDTPFNNNKKPVGSTRIDNIQIRCTNSLQGEQFDKTCNGIRCRGWNENCGISNVHINGFNFYGLFLTSNERTITQNCSFHDVLITNSNRADGKSIGLYLDDVRQCVFESFTIDNGPETKSGVGYGVYTIGHCDLNIFLKLNLEDCYHPIYVKEGIDECVFNALMVNNPTHRMKNYSSTDSCKAVIMLKQCKRGFIINGYKRVNNVDVEYDIFENSKKKHYTFNLNISTGNSNVRGFVYEPDK